MNFVGSHFIVNDLMPDLFAEINYRAFYCRDISVAYPDFHQECDKRKQYNGEHVKMLNKICA